MILRESLKLFEHDDSRKSSLLTYVLSNDLGNTVHVVTRKATLNPEASLLYSASLTESLQGITIHASQSYNLTLVNGGTTILLSSLGEIFTLRTPFTSLIILNTSSEANYIQYSLISDI